MLQWLRLYTLGRKASRELKTFLKILLISSRIDQKLKNKREIHRFLKGNFARRSWRIDAVVGADCRGHGSGFHWRCCGSQIGGELALISLQSESRSHHDRATIAPRSGHDRATIEPRSWANRDVDSQMNAVWWLWRGFRDEGATITVQLCHDRGFSSTSLPGRPMEVERSDAPESSTCPQVSFPIRITIAIPSRSKSWRKSDASNASTYFVCVARPMEIGRSWSIHAVSRDFRVCDRSQPSDEYRASDEDVMLSRCHVSLITCIYNLNSYPI